MVKIIFPFHFRGFDRTTRTTPGSTPEHAFLSFTFQRDPKTNFHNQKGMMAFFLNAIPLI